MFSYCPWHLLLSEKISLMALLLDLDNTLFDSVAIYETTIKRLEKNAKEFGFTNSNQFRQFYNMARNETKRDLPKNPTNQLRILYFKKMSESLFGRTEPKWVLRLEALYFRYFLNGIKEWKLKNKKDFNKILRLLTQIAESRDIILLTNENLRTQILKLTVLFPKSFPYKLMTSQEAGAEKPARIIFEKAMEFDSRKNHPAYMIGDSFEGDIEGALHFGINAIYICSILQNKKGGNIVMEKKIHKLGEYWESPSLEAGLNFILSLDSGRVVTR
ncbi:haloacid dehalogenase-like hydrolase [Leptospira broomii serovar Hurstbridge str. 5399]|uniref:Haloacid dehalogenase-like hydrolase n=2 Tax=Leptospira broomii TaxID=301541 RepID=T0F8I0_9LEPT|nr:haloacid dehalogenase-like hydrolase [Leptospira broomii serovar Hurstbridge str. 5399]